MSYRTEAARAGHQLRQRARDRDLVEPASLHHLGDHPGLLQLAVRDLLRRYALTGDTRRADDALAIPRLRQSRRRRADVAGRRAHGSCARDRRGAVAGVRMVAPHALVRAARVGARPVRSRESLQREDVGAVRRPTGGRVLLHDREVTYSVTAPAPEQRAAQGELSPHQRDPRRGDSRGSASRRRRRRRPGLAGPAAPPASPNHRRENWWSMAANWWGAPRCASAARCCSTDPS